MRLKKNADFDQQWLGPAFVDATAGYVVAGSGTLRHGVSVALSWNISTDGGYTEPIYSGEQWAITPSYLALFRLHSDLDITGRIGPEFVVSGRSKTWGFDLAAGAEYFLLAGFGAFGEASFDLVFGANSTLHPLVSLKIGLFIDYELIP